MSALNSKLWFNLGYWFPRLQWQRRIAWYLMRDFHLVTQGYADSGNFGRTPKVTQALDAFATPRIKH